MGKLRSPNRDKAFEVYKERGGRISPKKIAEIIGEENVKNIYAWKRIDEWDIKLHGKVGAPKGNKNAIGNNGGAPKGNLNNLQHGEYYNPTKHLEKDFLKKYLPTATRNIIKEVSEASLNSLDMLWTSIQLQYAAVIRSQKIMNVKSKNEMIKELKKTKIASEIDKKSKENKTIETYREEEFEFQFAWDRQATFLTSQSKALSTLQNLINKYEELLHKNWDIATAEQKLRVDKLKAEISGSSGEKSKEGIKEFIKATTISEDEVSSIFKDDENEQEETD